MSSEAPALGRFADSAVLVLASLAHEPRHGYGITRDVLSLTGIYLGPGTLYSTIARLEKKGWIRPLPAAGRRRPYAITPTGREFLRTECLGLKNFAESVLVRAGP